MSLSLVQAGAAKRQREVSPGALTVKFRLVMLRSIKFNYVPCSLLQVKRGLSVFQKDRTALSMSGRLADRGDAFEGLISNTDYASDYHAVFREGYVHSAKLYCSTSQWKLTHLWAQPGI